MNIHIKGKLFFAGLLSFWCFLLFNSVVSAQSVSILQDARGKPVLIKNQQAAAGRLPAGNFSSDSAKAFLLQNGRLLGLRGAAQELSLKRSITDSLGITHHRFFQIGPGGIPVCGAEVIARGSGSTAHSANGRVLPDTDQISLPALYLDAEEAGVVARSYAAQKHGIDPGKVRIEGSELCYFNLEFFTRRATAAQAGTRLSYKVTYRFGPVRHAAFIDAEHGQTLHWITLTHTDVSREVYDCSPGDGNCYIDTADPLSGTHILGRSEGSPTSGVNPRNGLTDTDNVYSVLGFSHNYFADRFGRNGANLQGGLGDGTNPPGGHPFAISAALVYLDYIPVFGQQICPNAFWNGVRLNFCNNLTTTDIVGHEYGHAVTQYEADLVYENESGALNESFSDIFGVGVERYRFGTHNWTLGEGSALGTLRNMSDPTSINTSLGRYPDRFYSSTFYCGSQDSGGVHFNSSVPNYAAYLMTEGGSFNGCTITGIGFSKMEQIFYRALSVYLTTTSGFNDAYAALIQSCNDLGYTQQECQQATNALQAVEMDQAGRCSAISRTVPVCAGGSGTPSPTPTVSGTPTSPPSTEPFPTPTVPPATLSNLELGAILLKRGSKTRYQLVGLATGPSSQPVSGVQIVISCSFKRRVASVSVVSDDLGEFGAIVNVNKNDRAFCTAASGNKQSGQLKLKYRAVSKRSRAGRR